MTPQLLIIHLFSPFEAVDIGFNLSYFVLGMGGGFVRSIYKDGVGLKHAAINIIVGGIVSTWATPVIVHRYTFTEREQIFPTALTIGFLAMGCFSIWERIERWAVRNPKFFIALFINWLTNASKSLNSDPGRSDSNDAGTSGSDRTVQPPSSDV